MLDNGEPRLATPDPLSTLAALVELALLTDVANLLDNGEPRLITPDPLSTLAALEEDGETVGDGEDEPPELSTADNDDESPLTPCEDGEEEPLELGTADNDDEAPLAPCERLDDPAAERELEPDDERDRLLELNALPNDDVELDAEAAPAADLLPDDTPDSLLPTGCGQHRTANTGRLFR